MAPAHARPVPVRAAGRGAAGVSDLRRTLGEELDRAKPRPARLEQAILLQDPSLEPGCGRAGLSSPPAGGGRGAPAG